MNWLENPATEQLFSGDQLTDWKKKFVDFLYENEVLKFGEFVLKSKRRSPIFLNFGDVKGGKSVLELGVYYTKAIRENFGGSNITTILGPSYKAIPIAVATSIVYSNNLDGLVSPELEAPEVYFTYDRKEEKAYGEASGVSREDAAKKLFVAHIPRDKDNILLVDDVITTGGTKLEEVDKLNSVVNVNLVGLIIGGNREEYDEDANDPVANLSQNLKIPVHSILNVVSEATPYLYEKGKIDRNIANKLKAYVRTYGIESTKEWCRQIRLIERNNGVIPACDVPLDKFERLVDATHDIEEIVAYKVGFEALLGGLDEWVKVARKYTNKPIIYDHQKAGTDIPDTGKRFAEIMKTAGVDAAIIFPQSGPKTQWEWIHSLFEQGIEVIVGGEMTHPKYKVSEGGYINDEKIRQIYQIGAKAGVNNFVMPGNKPDLLEFYRDIVIGALPMKSWEEFKPAIYSPGLVAQGGKISDAVKIAGERWYAIVGRGIYGEKDMRKAALEHVSQLKN